MNKRMNYVALICAVLILAMIAFGQTRSVKVHVPGVENTLVQQVSYSPVQFGVNVLTLPASAATADSTTVSFVGVRAATLLSQCTQIATLQVKIYAEDGTTLLITNGQPITSIPATTTAVYFGTEVDLNASQGTVGAFKLRLPQRAMAFNFLNTTVTPGTCTARLLLHYD